MYIELGSTRINYRENTSNDYVILAQVVDSSLSYEKPTIVRSVEELDIWFGRDYSDREYLIELLNLGISLYLYKPVSPEPNKEGISGYIDFSEYERYPLVINYYQRLITNNDYKVENILYTVKINETDTEDYFYVKEEDSFISVNDLKQNQTPYNTKSLNNRDTLTIFENSGQYYPLSPSFITNLGMDLGVDELDFTIGKFKEFSDSEMYLGSNMSNIDFSRVSNNTQTCAYNLSFDEHYLFNDISDELNYLVLGTVVHGFFKGSDVSSIPDNIKTSFDDLCKNLNGYKQVYVFNVDVSNGKEKILECFSNSNYKHTSNDINTAIYSEVLENTRYFYNISGFSMESDFNYTNNSVYKNLINRDNYKQKISFISKTIGTGDIDGNIEIKIEKPSDNIYRISIQRFGYVEVFEGTIIGTNNNIGIDELINNNSKLVYCRIDDRKSLPIGSWELKGGIKENETSEKYVKSLNCLSNPPEPIYFDYLLIPDIEKYPTEKDISGNYYKVYKDLLDLSKNIGCQVLIQNSFGKVTTNFDFEIINSSTGAELFIITREDIGYINNELIIEGEEDIYYSSVLTLKGTNRSININQSRVATEDEFFIDQGNYSFNYLDDNENRLIYFYGSMEVYGSSRPGYYIYLMNLFLDNYSATSKQIYYNTPIREYYTSLFNKNINDIQTLSELEIVKELDKKKCNYLLSNNHVYYYEKYQNGSSYTTTGWMRFCIEKIKRELIKNKWTILESRNYGKMESNIKQILNNIKNSFSMVKELELSDLKISYVDKKIDIQVDSYISDLVNNNIRIDVTLNYNA